MAESVYKTRFCNMFREPIEAEQIDVTGWMKWDPIIVAVRLSSNSSDSGQYKLMWRNVTDGGSFAYVSSSGEVNYSVSTACQDDYAHNGFRCSSNNGNWRVYDDEGNNLNPGAFSVSFSSSFDLELHFGIGFSGAHWGDEYEFQVYNARSGKNYVVGTCTPTVTIGGSVSSSSLSSLSLSSSSSSYSLKPEWAFGEESPSEQNIITWNTWEDDDGNVSEVDGDVEWGKLRLRSDLDEIGYSQVMDCKSVKSRQFSVEVDKYGTSSGSYAVYIRGSSTSFTADAGSPAWSLYSVPVIETWRYVQLKVVTDF